MVHQQIQTLVKLSLCQTIDIQNTDFYCLEFGILVFYNIHFNIACISFIYVNEMRMRKNNHSLY